MFYNQYHTYVNLRKTCLVSIQYVGDVVLCRHIIPGIIPPIIECMTIFAVDIVSVHVNSYTNVTNVIYYSLRHYNINRYIDDWRSTIVHVGIFHMQSYYSYTTNIPWWSYTSNIINACIGLCILIKKCRMNTNRPMIKDKHMLMAQRRLLFQVAYLLNTLVLITIVVLNRED